MRGVFGLLLIGGGVILVYGLFTGKINFAVPNSAPPIVSTIPAPVIGGAKCPPGQHNVGGVCSTDPHNCGSGFIWDPSSNKCRQLIG